MSDAKTIVSKKYRGLGSRETIDVLIPYLFIAPFILSYLVFIIFPGIYSFILSFYHYRGYGEAEFVGIANYKVILTYGTFWDVVNNTLFYLFWHTFPVIFAAFLLAVLINSKLIHSKLKNVYKPLIFVPQIIAIVSATLVFRVMFSTDTGVINRWFGTEIPFLTDLSLAKWIVALLIDWRSLGWYLIIFLAGLTTVSHDVEEAATIDGANARQRLFYVILPLMKPIFLFAFLVNSIYTMKLYTEPAVLIGSAGMSSVSSDVAPVMSLLVSYIAGGRFGMASAVGWLLFIAILIFSIIQFRLFKERD